MENKHQANIYIFKQKKAEAYVTSSIIGQCALLARVENNAFNSPCDPDQFISLVTQHLELLKMECEELNESKVEFSIAAISVHKAINDELSQMIKIADSNKLEQKELDRVSKTISLDQKVLSLFDKWGAVNPIWLRIEALHDGHDVVYSLLCEEELFLKTKDEITKQILLDKRAYSTELKSNQ